MEKLKLCAKIISYLFLLVVISVLFFYYNKNVLEIFKRFNWKLLYLIIFLQIPMIAFGGLAFKVLCLPFDINLRWQEWFGLSFIANFINQILPYRPGIGFRYLYMRQHYRMKITDYACSTLVYFLMTLSISSIFMLLGWCWGNIPKTFNMITLFAGILTLFVLGFILWVKIRPTVRTNFIHKAFHAIQMLINKPYVFYGAFLSLLLVNFITVLIFYFIFIAAQAPLALTDCLFLVGIITIAGIFPITPANIGVLETLAGTLTQVLYHNFSLGFSVTALFRATQWIPSFILGMTFSLKLAGSLIPKFKE